MTGLRTNAKPSRSACAVSTARNELALLCEAVRPSPPACAHSRRLMPASVSQSFAGLFAKIAGVRVSKSTPWRNVGKPPVLKRQQRAVSYPPIRDAGVVAPAIWQPRTDSFKNARGSVLPEEDSPFNLTSKLQDVFLLR